MRPSASPALRALYKYSNLQACHFVAGRRFPIPKRSFHISRRRLQQNDPAKGSETAWTHVAEEPSKPPKADINSQEVEEVVDHADGGPYTPSKPVDRSNYGSGAKRAGRNIKRPIQLPPLQIPHWFVERNVVLREVISKEVNVRHVQPKMLESSAFKNESPPEASGSDINGMTEGFSEDTLQETPGVSQKDKDSAEEVSVSGQITEGEAPASEPDGITEVPSEAAEQESPSASQRENSSLQEGSYSKQITEGEGLSASARKTQSLPESNGFYEIQGSIRSYQMNDSVFDEISSLVSAGLKPSPSHHFFEDWTSSKLDLALYCPLDGGSFFLDELVKYLASMKHADLIRLDAQDIAEIGGNYLDERRDTHTRSLSSLGYEAYRIASEQAAMRESQATEDPAEDDEEGEVEEDFGRNQSRPGVFRASGMGIIPIGDLGGNIGELIKSAITEAGAPNTSNSPSNVKVFTQAVDSTRDDRMTKFVDVILSASEIKRMLEDGKGNMEPASPAEELESEAAAKLDEASIEENSQNTPPSDTRQPTESLIITIRDYAEINSTFSGGKMLEKIHEIVRRRRREGQRILVIGTSSSKDLIPALSKSAFHRLQSEPDNGPTRTILTPCRTQSSEGFSKDQKVKMALINLRNLQYMLRRLASAPIHLKLIPKNVTDSPWLMAFTQDPFPQSYEYLLALGQYIWPLDFVHHVATITLGVLGDQDKLAPNHLVEALRLVSRSDSAKLEWIDHEKKQENTDHSLLAESPFIQLSSEESEERMKKLRKTCNTHEKKLLNGVIDAQSIRTTFADVQAPPETIEALKTLTSLSLVRPDAFTYGVLATDKIPGLLLYGPPGTGKTVLAKAVAKESGATVLEVSGSDVYDMYVGEGEKNVKAIFSLAKKLTPCIVFIDEADAILGSRGGSSHRTTHRELINQFLREWDGMNELSAFIMVATNRPFDLDEACLRRLPRRLLVDLPTETDREAILRIHLKDENLDSSVSISTIASQTPFYSGSDLKNLAVAAALACVREEFEQATAAATSPATLSPSLPGIKTPKKSYEYPKKRTLSSRHFTRGMEEISASISEDMGSLNAIRKFDEKYGDRRGRRKRLGGYGFDTIKEGEKNRSDAARVRNR